jgi:hypothetical protein
VQQEVRRSRRLLNDRQRRDREESARQYATACARALKQVCAVISPLLKEAA